MSLETQLAALTAELKRVADLLTQGAKLPPTTESASKSGSKVEKPKAETKAKVTEEVPETKAETKPKETAKEALTPTKEMETGDGKPDSDIKFEDLSKHFFAFLATARQKLGREPAKKAARDMLDAYQNQNGQPLDVTLLDVSNYDTFYADIDRAFEELEEVGDE